MKKLYLVVLLFITAGGGFCQLSVIDSLKYELSVAKDDSTRINISYYLMGRYRWSKPDSSLYYGHSALAMAQKKNYRETVIDLYFALSLIYGDWGNTEKAAEMCLNGLDVTMQYGTKYAQANFIIRLSQFYYETGDIDAALKFLRKAKELYEAEGKESAVFVSLCQNRFADICLADGRLDSAVYYNDDALKNWEYINRTDPGNRSLSRNLFIKSKILFTRAHIFIQKKDYSAAIGFFKEGLNFTKYNFNTDVIKNQNELARIFLVANQPDSAILYAGRSLTLSDSISHYKGISESATILAEIYKERDPRLAISYLQKAVAANDSAATRTKVNAVKNLIGFNEQQRQYEIETATRAYQNKIRQYILLAGLAVLFLIAFLLYRNNRQKQKANSLLQQQKEEIKLQKDKTEEALAHLKSTQQQLIQSEKMASLGELTAGIAHEIQNPLNFVNNFSEVSNELLDEMNAELEKGDISEAKLIAGDVKQNLEKINHHGKRADAIVKGMLQHSRSSSAVKEPTDINALCDEYLRLAYHGLRAKDKSFNAKFDTQFDESIGKINVMPQEMGRVVLNLINNAFYAVNEKAKSVAHNAEGYEPAVTVSTKKQNGKVMITVADNGTGIPQKVVDKIFQPFFTTKPTGEGTGLGLSLAYDIITKGHNGELKVETKEGEGSKFILSVPLSN